MKKIYTIIQTLSLLLLVAVPTQAQVKHAVGIWGEVGEATMLTSSESQLKNSLGAGGAIGVNYELRAGKHFLLDLGLGGGLSHGLFAVRDSAAAVTGLIDEDGDPFTYLFAFADRQDSYTSVNLQVPVMLGAQFHRFYFLVGVKANLSLMTRTKQKMQLSTIGVYDEFIGDFENMPDHGFYNKQPMEQKGSINFRPDVMGSAEIGWRLGPIYNERGYDVPKQKIHYRLGLFADYGLFDIHFARSNQALSVPSDIQISTPALAPARVAANATPNMLDGVRVTDILSTKDAAKKVQNLMVGVKFAVYFTMPDKRHCVVCQDHKPVSHRTGGLLE